MRKKFNSMFAVKFKGLKGTKNMYLTSFRKENSKEIVYTLTPFLKIKKSLFENKKKAHKLYRQANFKNPLVKHTFDVIELSNNNLQS